MTKSEEWEQFSAYRPMIEDAIQRGRKQREDEIIAMITGEIENPSTKKIRNTYASAVINYPDGTTVVTGTQCTYPSYVSNGDGTFDLYYFPTYRLIDGIRLGEYTWRTDPGAWMKDV